MESRAARFPQELPEQEIKCSSGGLGTLLWRAEKLSQSQLKGLLFKLKLGNPKSKQGHKDVSGHLSILSIPPEGAWQCCPHRGRARLREPGLSALRHGEGDDGSFIRVTQH